MAPEPDSVLPLLTLLANLLRRSGALRYRRELNLAQVEWGIIGILGVDAPLTLGGLAHRAGLDKAQVSRSVTSLTALDIVSRGIGRDSRELSLSLTKEGLRLHALLAGSMRERAASLLTDLTTEERAVLETALPKLTLRARALLADEQGRSPDQAG